MKVLVVDDEPMSRRAAARTLQLSGYDVTTACDGREALDILAAGQHRLVVSDWRMPRMDGIALCRAIRSGEIPHYVYFIMLTGQTRSEETLDGLRAGADDYINKPFNPAELILRVGIGRRIVGLETRDMTIFVLAKLAESRDPDTGAHLERVQIYCREIARQLRNDPKYRDEVNDEFIDLIHLTSPLHDIGKVAIPDSVLLKPGRLTEVEFEIMKTHSHHGAATLDAALKAYPDTPFLKMARNIAQWHHEKYDGTGYPDGLSGDKIPLCARIMALADVYDALTSVRVYKEAYTHDVAKSMIVEQSGLHFDPAIVAAFLAVEAKFDAIRDRFVAADSSEANAREVAWASCP